MHNVGSASTQRRESEQQCGGVRVGYRLYRCNLMDSDSRINHSSQSGSNGPSGGGGDCNSMEVATP